MTEETGLTSIYLENQPHDCVFSPNNENIYIGLLTGEIKGFSFNETSSQRTLRVRPTKKSCRGIDISQDGNCLYSVSKDGSIHFIDATTGQIIEAKEKAHEHSISRVKLTMPNLLATGDDEGVVKIWDTRTPQPLRQYTHHFDYISDFYYEDAERRLLTTSADGTLSVIDVRSNKAEPVGHSEDQEDELLSIAPLAGTSKYAVGTQLGVLSIFNSKQGWGDCVDRIPGHPQSIDALVSLGPSILATGSSDGLIRVMGVLPTKFMGVIGDHGEFPIERMKVSSDSKWLASMSHNDELMMTRIDDMFEDSDGEDAAEEYAVDVTQDKDSDSDDDEEMQSEEQEEQEEPEETEEKPEPMKKKSKKNKHFLEDDSNSTFFDDL
ncbi:monoubiquitination-related protein [Wallemia mellicola]|uniref:WD repeat-containing protein JIP5 n=1 Tax=Wallemia mellicola TaxID=1708541 RepID=A0A4T0R963_9BASI|nr:monoubiquitination-related protein [Wallemia mellicola]